jgi:hypothetical protein
LIAGVTGDSLRLEESAFEADVIAKKSVAIPNEKIAAQRENLCGVEWIEEEEEEGSCIKLALLTVLD